MSPTQHPLRAHQHGRTLLELLIGLAIGLVVLGAIFAIHLATSASSRQSTAISRLNEDASLALALVGSQLRMAGFSLPRRDHSTGGATVNGALMAIPDRNFMGAGIRGCDHGFSNPTVDSFDGLACSDDVRRSAAFAIRFEGASLADGSAVLLPPSKDCLGQNVSADPASTYPLVESRYFARVSASSGTPELFCGGNGRRNYTAQSLVQYVEDMQIWYGIAADGAGRDVQAFVKAAEIDAFAGTVDDRWSRVVSVKLCLVMRTAQPEADPGASYVGCDGAQVAPGAPDDRLLRRAYSGVFTLRNRGGFAVDAS